MIARWYRLALRAFPKRHRDLYEAEMLDAFDRQLLDARSAGNIAALRFVVAATLNAVEMGIAERRRHRVVRFGYLFSPLDFTLAWRVLMRYRGLSIVSVFGMATGIAVAGGGFAVISAIVEVKLPLPEGERVVSVINTDVAMSGHEWRMVHDYARWRNAASLVDLSLSHEVSRNLIVEDRTPEPVEVVEVTPAAFRVAGVDAFRGRFLLDEDARLTADDVIVIGYDEWVRRFNGDPEIVGRTVQLGGITHTIVGVMPDGYAFPINHSFWIPLRIDPAVYQPFTGPNVTVFGRLAPGATFETAQAEFTGIALSAATASPQTHQHVRTLVIPYTYAFNDMADPVNVLAVRAMLLAMVLLLVLVCVNVAILVYARTATRQGEIAVRGALGASRLRIVSQLFVEALTLAGVAAAIGVSLISVAMPLLEGEMLMITGGRLPFWMHFTIAFDDLAYLVGLTVLSAAIVGVLPALKVTGRNMHGRLQTLSGGGGSRMQMGPLWTLLIVAQVALTVTLLPVAMYFTWDGLRLRGGDMGFASGEVVTATLTLDRASGPPSADEQSAFMSRFGAAHAQLDEALRANPSVIDVTHSLVDAETELAMALEADGQQAPADPVDYNITEGKRTGHLARYNRVAVNFFDTYGVPPILGRDLATADLGTNHVIVNRTLASVVFSGANPLGGRVKYVGRSREAGIDDMPLEQWFEIVGVVPDFPENELEPEPRVYHPVLYGAVNPAHIAVRVRDTEPAAFANTLREIAAEVSPSLQVRDIATLEMIVKREQNMFRFIGVTVGVVMLSVITLSAAGIYALMSFTVARRRREIGIRTALGANRHRLLAGIFSRVAAQLAAGAAAGMIGAVGLASIIEGNILEKYFMVLLPLVALMMMVIGLLAAYGPARQGLSIQPTEALREE